MHRALGTALEWPEAKKKAGQVREWGIEVYRDLTRRHSVKVTDL